MARDGLEIRLRLSGAAPADNGICDAVYRIAQEALNNVTKHARAKHVRMTLSSGNGTIRLVVDDDGVGVRRAHRADGTHGGMGMTFMKERAEVLGGSLSVQPRQVKGTRVIVAVPVRPPEVIGILG